jgi:hypothetical protein
LVCFLLFENYKTKKTNGILLTKWFAFLWNDSFCAVISIGEIGLRGYNIVNKGVEPTHFESGLNFK